MTHRGRTRCSYQPDLVEAATSANSRSAPAASKKSAAARDAGQTSGAPRNAAMCVPAASLSKSTRSVIARSSATASSVDALSTARRFASPCSWAIKMPSVFW